METRKIKTNVKVWNKVDRHNYRIVSVNNAGGLAYALLPDDSIDETIKPMVINENNAIAFRLLEDPNIPDVPQGYSVNNGVLLKNGAPATQQGSLLIKRIIAEVPGRLILAVEPREPREGYMDLMTYTVEGDKFNKLIRASIPEVYEANIASEDKVYLTYSRTYEKDFEDDGKTVSKTVFDAAAVMLYDIKSDRIESHYMATAPIDTIISVKNSSDLAVITSADVDDDGVVVPASLLVTQLNDELEELSETLIETLPEVISKAMYSLIKAGNVFYFEDREVKVPAVAVTELTGYDLVVDITRKENQKRVALVNDNMEVKILVIESTRDRGNIITVETP